MFDGEVWIQADCLRRGIESLLHFGASLRRAGWLIWIDTLRGFEVRFRLLIFAAQAREAAKQLGGPGNSDDPLAAPINSYDPMEPYVHGKLKEWEGNDDGALKDYLQAVKLLESDRRKLGDVEDSGSFLGDRIEIYYAAALQHLDRKQYPAAFELIERSRAGDGRGAGEPGAVVPHAGTPEPVLAVGGLASADRQSAKQSF